MKTIIFLALSVLSVLSHAQQIETVFNTPGFTGQSTTTIEDKLIELTRAAVPGSTLRAALYAFNRVPMAEAFIEASKRGVNVELIFDGGNKASQNVPGHAINRLVNELVCAPGEDCVKFCTGPLAPLVKLTGIKKDYPLGNSCRGLIINHNKLFLFSELSTGEKNVVVQTSANMMEHQLEMYNDLIEIKNDPGLFEGFMQYWTKLKADHTVLFKKSFHNLEPAMSKVKVYFFPRLTGGDPVVALLKRVNCRIPGSYIRAVQAAFTRPKVAEEMKRLESEGCSLQVITRIDPAQSSPGDKVSKILGTSMLVLPFKGKTPEQQLVNSTHTKLVLINASIDNSKWRTPIVLTGSHNLDLFSLRTNDETLLEISDPETFKKYDAFVSKLLEDAVHANVRFF